MSHDLYQHLLDMLGAKDHADAGRIIGELHAKELAAAPPAASGRARELVWTQIKGDVWRADIGCGEYLCGRLRDDGLFHVFQPPGMKWRDERNDYETLEDGKAACQQHFNAYVRTLLAPTVDERAASSEPEMCPNCVTPWKCNGPHEFPAATSEAPVAWRYVRGMSSYIDQGPPPTQEEYGMFDSITPLYTHPASTTADAGVTEAMVETFEAKFLECARTRPDSTLRDDIRAALVAALGARKGK